MKTLTSIFERVARIGQSKAVSSQSRYVTVMHGIYIL